MSPRNHSSEPSPDRSEAWPRIAEAARHSQSGEAGDEAAPYGFATRVASRWRELREDTIFRAWQRWSLRTACGTTALFVAVAMFHLRSAPVASADEILLPIPAVEIPAPGTASSTETLSSTQSPRPE